MSNTKNKTTIDIPALEKEFTEIYSESMAKPIANGMLRDGRNYQVQVIITTDEDEFIEE